MYIIGDGYERYNSCCKISFKTYSLVAHEISFKTHLLVTSGTNFRAYLQVHDITQFNVETLKVVSPNPRSPVEPLLETSQYRDC